MPTTQDQINEVLSGIEALLKEIASLREQYATVQMGLKQVKDELSNALRLVHEEADRLEVEERNLRIMLEQRSSLPLPATSSVLKPIVNPPPALIGTVAEPEVHALSQKTRRKRELANFIVCFTNDQNILETLNAIRDDDRWDVGDILEIIPWDKNEELWKARRDWEAEEAQFGRLSGWRVVLEERRLYWQALLSEIEKSLDYPLFIHRRTADPTEWQATLQNEADKQAQKNERLKAKIKVWQEQLKAQPPQGNIENA
jgi:hypothetical protein